MKITIPKTLTAIGITIAYIVWMILITLSRITQIFPYYIWNLVLSSIFTIAYAWIFFYLAAILRAKGQKMWILISFMIFMISTTLFSGLNLVRQLQTPRH